MKTSRLMVTILSSMNLLIGCRDALPPAPEKALTLREEMVRVPAGAFVMGTDEFGRDEGPAHTVVLDAFRIDRFEVTHADYVHFSAATGYFRSAFADTPGVNAPDQPVVGVNWFDAAAFCEWAGKRLCTEAEWEKAARGTDGRLYPWGNAVPTAERLNFNGAIGGPMPVGHYPQGASPFGAVDMAGNVWEWVADWYRVEYYGESPARNPKGPDSGGLRVMRGGSWVNGAPAVRVHERGRLKPKALGKDIGFRCCRDG